MRIPCRKAKEDVDEVEEQVEDCGGEERMKECELIHFMLMPNDKI